MGFFRRAAANGLANKLHSAYFTEADRQRGLHESQTRPLRDAYLTGDDGERVRVLDVLAQIHRNSMRIALHRAFKGRPPEAFIPPDALAQIELNCLSAFIAPTGVELRDLVQRMEQQHEIQQELLRIREDFQRRKDLSP